MKANAPEKIYLNQDDGLIWHCRSYKDDIEYTRTDAFIEKACAKLKKLMYDNLMFQGRLYREEIIESFAETFRKYMKGE